MSIQIQVLLSFIRRIICRWNWGRLVDVKYKSIVAKYQKRRAIKRLQLNGKECLEKVNGLLSELKVDYYCEYGTLLGLIREKGLIKYDDDLDFGLPPGKDISLEMYKALKESGFIFKRAFVWRGIITEIAFSYKSIPVDFFFTFYDENACVYGQCYNDFVVEDSKDVAKQVTRVYKPSYCGVTEISVMGIDVKIPVNYEDFLVADYGKGWRTPIKDFKADGSELRREQFEDSALIVLEESELIKLIS